MRKSLPSKLSPHVSTPFFPKLKMQTCLYYELKCKFPLAYVNETPLVERVRLWRLNSDAETRGRGIRVKCNIGQAKMDGWWITSHVGDCKLSGARGNCSSCFYILLIAIETQQKFFFAALHGQGPVLLFPAEAPSHAHLRGRYWMSAGGYFVPYLCVFSSFAYLLLNDHTYSKMSATSSPWPSGGTGESK